MPATFVLPRNTGRTSGLSIRPGEAHGRVRFQLQSPSQGAATMASMQGGACFFNAAKRVLQFGLPAGLGVWVVLFIILGGLGLPELMLLLGAPVVVAATLWFVGCIVESYAVPTRQRQH